MHRSQRTRRLHSGPARRDSRCGTARMRQAFDVCPKQLPLSTRIACLRRNAARTGLWQTGIPRP
jgi:hypothetical protein